MVIGDLEAGKIIKNTVNITSKTNFVNRNELFDSNIQVPILNSLYRAKLRPKELLLSLIDAFPERLSRIHR